MDDCTCLPCVRQPLPVDRSTVQSHANVFLSKFDYTELGLFIFMLENNVPSSGRSLPRCPGQTYAALSYPPDRPCLLLCLLKARSLQS
jgi:hypothetical protein